MTEIDILFDNIDLILRNKDKILSDVCLSSVKVKGSGIYFQNGKYICFTLKQLIKLWTANRSTWWFNNHLIYKLVFLKGALSGLMDAYSKTIIGDGYMVNTYDKNIIIPMIEDMVIIGGVRIKEKNMYDVIRELKEVDDI